MATKRKSIVTEDGDILEIMPIGAGNEVGRSCILMKYKDKNIMFDCGIHPAYTGLSALPFFDEVDPSIIDLLLVSHFHLDHAAALPYFLEKTSFKGRVFMTHPTKAIYKMLLTDYVKVSNIAIEEMLYDEADLTRSMEKIETINYHQELEHNGIKFKCYNAGHVLGAAMFLVEIAGVRILYTGDFSRQEDRHLMAAETPGVTCDVLIVESTYGIQVHEPRLQRESRFTSLVHQIVKRGGRCLLPVFALGRAQELLLILDEYWEDHPELHNIPIYYASTLAKKCMTVYRTYINMMNERIRRQLAVSNPFVFKHISNLKSIDHFDDVGPCVVMASPGMLQSGLSRELFELWCSDERNGVILPGYCVEGTLAKTIITGSPEEITALNGKTLKLRMSVDYISFSAHSDFQQTSEFVDLLQPPYIILVHGDSNEMARLKKGLLEKYDGKNIQVLTPKNCQAVQLKFKAEKIAKTVGKLASGGPVPGTKVSGLVVVKDFNHNIISPSELPTYTHLTTAQVSQKMTVPCKTKFMALKIQLNNMYDSISDCYRHDKPALQIYDSIYVIHNSPDTVVVEWTSDPVNDMLADSIISQILQSEVNPTAPQPLLSMNEDEEAERLNTMRSLLSKQFGEVRLDLDTSTFTINFDNIIATVDHQSKQITCENDAFKQRLKIVLRRIESALYPIPN